MHSVCLDQPGLGARATLLLAAGFISLACMEKDLVAPELDELDEEVAALAEAAGDVYFPPPGAEWERRSADQVGMSSTALQEAVDFALENETSYPVDLRVMLEERLADLPDRRIVGPVKPRGKANGVVVRHGYIITEWGTTKRVDMAFSVTESFLATIAGLALDRGTIGNPHDLVRDYVDDGGFDTLHNRPITWHHMLQQTSEWEGEVWGKLDAVGRREGIDRELQPPGTFWESNEVRVNRLALSLLRVWEGPLPEVLRRELMQPISASRTWEWHGYRNSYINVVGESVQSVSGGEHWGGGLWISTRDLARFGYLYLRKGRWGETQVLSEDWIRMATTESDVRPGYGYLFWLNTGQEMFPAAPATAYAARGAGDTNLVYIDPENDLVIVQRWVDGASVPELIERVLGAIETG